ncbi:molybdate ABC transporter substrate-binding protein [Phytoactinopolyspora endophytica]|uniref:molybdate ABC transporter substrate-binding protein n=1 Tax=Phytoactinopolyspora endophytica TaxID=1642495 RepID=UPI00101C6CB3|nr:molybdate ABC transporter substrate-binding protein [Phytoactinopolyspora endophytica]
MRRRSDAGGSGVSKRRLRAMDSVRVALIVLGAGALALLGQPANGGGGDEDTTGAVTVLAAASMTDALEELVDQLADEYPDLEIVSSFGPSPGLAAQVLAGAPADILITADTATMEPVVRAGVTAGDVRVVARNALVLAVPPGNPGGVTHLADLSREELLIALCEPRVPCGAASEELLAFGGVQAAPDTYATDVKQAAGLVRLGEVDAALVYRTDAAAAGDEIESIGLPMAADVANEYPAALLRNSPNPAAARVVLDVIDGEPGRKVLAESGFLEP